MPHMPPGVGFSSPTRTEEKHAWPPPGPLSMTEALRILFSRPLMFNDPEQIEALARVEQINIRCTFTLAACGKCKGAGRCPIPCPCQACEDAMLPCTVCGGSGRVATLHLPPDTPGEPIS